MEEEIICNRHRDLADAVMNAVPTRRREGNRRRAQLTEDDGKAIKRSHFPWTRAQERENVVGPKNRQLKKMERKPILGSGLVWAHQFHAFGQGCPDFGNRW